MIDHARLVELLCYDPLTGVFTRKITTAPRAQVGDVAGTVSASDGYRYIRLDTQRYPAHQLAWFYVHGVWPTSLLDHRDGNGDHNAIGNLRLANFSKNGANRGKNTNNTTGFKGVCARKGRFIAKIKAEGKTHNLGMFGQAEEAARAYDAAAIKHFGVFAVTNSSLGLFV